LSEARAVSTAEGVRALFEKFYPQISVAYSNFDRESGRPDDGPSGFEEFCEETARSRLWIWEIRSILCSRLSVGNVVLLGDAAHAMSPSLGMGMNSGLEDVTFLIDALERQNWEVQPALSTYDADRRKDMHALVLKSHVFTRDYSSDMKEQMLSVATERMLTSALPQIFKKRNAMEEMGAPGIPFYEIVKHLNFYVWCFRLLAFFAVVLAAFMVVFAFYFLRLFVLGRMV
jgi:FAD binding domain